jgi:hypothetical protein
VRIEHVAEREGATPPSTDFKMKPRELSRESESPPHPERAGKAAEPALSARSAVSESATRGKDGPVAGQRAVAKDSLPANVAAIARKSSRLLLPADLKTAEVGQVIEALEEAGDDVAVVKLTVVDQSKGLAGFQSLLVRNTTLPRPDPREVERVKSAIEARQQAGIRFKAAEPVSGPEDLICVYVEGPRDELASVINGMRSEAQIQSAELTNTISVDRLADLSGNDRDLALVFQRQSQRGLSEQAGSRDDRALRYRRGAKNEAKKIGKAADVEDQLARARDKAGSSAGSSSQGAENLAALPRQQVVFSLPASAAGQIILEQRVAQRDQPAAARAGAPQQSAAKTVAPQASPAPNAAALDQPVENRPLRRSSVQTSKPPAPDERLGEQRAPNARPLNARAPQRPSSLPAVQAAPRAPQRSYQVLFMLEDQSAARRPVFAPRP